MKTYHLLLDGLVEFKEGIAFRGPSHSWDVVYVDHVLPSKTDPTDKLLVCHTYDKSAHSWKEFLITENKIKKDLEHHYWYQEHLKRIGVLTVE